jgi:AraC-like DNA-binding protein
MPPIYISGKKTMELETPDRGYYPGYRMPLWYNPQEDFHPDRGYRSRFRLILVEDGSGILRLGDWRGSFIAPVLFCLNETEQPALEQDRGVRAQALYFHPALINSLFDFKVIRKREAGLEGSDSQDLFWLRPFTQRQPGSFTPVSLGPSGARRVAELMRTVGGEIAAQSNVKWPCRSRSYFLELLFVIERAYNNPNTKEVESLADSPQAIDAVILHLHTHYQQKITLADLAHTFHTNRTTLAAQFHRATGLSVLAYLTRLRMRLAALILRDTELEIGQVMERVGCRDYTHFGRTFRRFKGCTPSEYRRANK